MNNGKTIFSQIMSLIPEREFKTCVDRYNGNYRVRNFSCKDQFLVMSYAQLTNRGSLRDIENCLTALSSRLYHCGISYAVPRNTLAKANEKRDWRIYADFAQVLLRKVRPLYAKDDFRLDLDNMVYAFDSSTMSLCLKLCPWAKFRKHKGGIKLHTLYDVKTSIPTIVLVTNAKVHDVNMLDELSYEKGSFYIMDKGYVDFTRLHKLHTCGAYFVTRAKDNMRFRRMYSREVDKTTGIKCDQIGMLETYKSLKAYPDKLRRVKYYDEEQDREFVFITNNMELSAEEVALLYKNRWQVELFFKWIKQHLKVKSFWGTTMNAVKTQVYCAIITYCLVAIVAYKLKVNRPIYEILQILSFSLLDKTPVREILTNCDYKNVKELNYKQLKISWD